MDYNYNINTFGVNKYVPYGKLVLKTGPASTPITLAEAKSFLRIDSDYDDDDNYITSLINVATGVVEEFTRRRLITQTFNIFHDEFPSYIDLQVGDVASVTHIKYYDESNVLQTLAASNYDVDTKIRPGRIYQSDDGDFPNTFDRPNAVEVEFVVGGAASDIPAPIIQAIYIIVGRYYENRQDVVMGTQVNELPLMVDHLLTPYRLLEL
tara:strand:- start:2634 stop:3260 length:627 start_codon:yes stop_codon:yes gene_type:complete